MRRGVDRVVEQSPPSPDALHRLHREMRRLHLGLAVWSRLLGRREREALRPTAQRLRRLGRLVGQVRDRDVVLGLLDSVETTPSDRDEGQRYHAFQSRLRDDSRTERELLQAFLRTERDAGLFDTISGLLDVAPPRTATARLRQMLHEEHDHRWERVQKAHRKARRRPSVDRLHRLRIRVRQLRHISELTSVVDPTLGRAVPVAFRRLQDHLGRLHDLDVAVLTLDLDLVDSPWGRALGERRRRERQAARAALAALSLVRRAPSRARPAGPPRRAVRR